MATFEISEKDYLAASRIAMRIPLKIRVLFSLSPLLAIIPFIFDMSSDVKGGVIGGILAGIITLTLMLYFRLPAMWKSQYQSYKQLQLPMTIEFNDNRIAYSNNMGATKIRFEDIYKWRDSDTYILIYQAKNLFFIVPKRIENEVFDIEKLRRLLVLKVGDPA